MHKAISSQVILASTSKIRQMLLKNAGLSFTSMAPIINELRQQQQLSGFNPRELSVNLAIQKSQSLAVKAPTALILGADQTLELEGQILHKPLNLDAAKYQLRQLRGKTHHLHSSLCCTKAGQVIWTCTESAELEVRSFSDKFLDDYIHQSANSILDSVGAYKLEGLGVQLFSKISGDYFTILGLPLLPLLSFLRQQNCLEA